MSMAIINKTKNTTVAESHSALNGILDKIIGKIKNRTEAGVVLYTRFGVHTFLMKNPIDVLILDREFRVRAYCKKMVQNRVFLWNPTFDIVIEIPSGRIDKSKTEIGDKLQII